MAFLIQLKFISLLSCFSPTFCCHLFSHICILFSPLPVKTANTLSSWSFRWLFRKQCCHRCTYVEIYCV